MTFFFLSDFTVLEERVRLGNTCPQNLRTVDHLSGPSVSVAGDELSFSGSEVTQDHAFLSLLEYVAPRCGYLGEKPFPVLSLN